LLLFASDFLVFCYCCCY